MMSAASLAVAVAAASSVLRASSDMSTLCLGCRTVQTGGPRRVFDDPRKPREIRDGGKVNE